MSIGLPFRNLIPTFFAGLIDDPILLVRTRPDGRHLMFDCGQIHHLAKRTFTHLDAIFVSHAHMDHWMGIDAIVRQLIAAGKTVDIYGGAGLADKFEHKLRGYDWNLAEDYWSSFRVHELHPECITCDLFSGADSFARRKLAEEQRQGTIIYRNNFLEVSSTSCDHRVASQVFRINERSAYMIDRSKLAEMGLQPGAWLGELKRCHLQQREFPSELKLTRNENGMDREIIVHDVRGLVEQLMRPQPVHSIGYISDVGFSEENRNKILELMQGVDLLLCECTFLQEAKDRARMSWHLCTDDVNELLDELRPQFFLPMHLSRSYSRRSEDLYKELESPSETRVLQIPLQLTPRPLVADEVEWREYDGAG